MITFQVDWTWFLDIQGSTIKQLIDSNVIIDVFGVNDIEHFPDMTLLSRTAGLRTEVGRESWSVVHRLAGKEFNGDGSQERRDRSLSVDVQLH